jgi:hypothetical protein
MRVALAITERILAIGFREVTPRSLGIAILPPKVCHNPAALLEYFTLAGINQ